ncbi:transmembrane protein 74-like [Denticeps clupeoides]|uniref:transmembrane protein 74-like n=1 Tax=Denticeps clupeoides TaxID=299321 RepID=UPI0010A34503|nr:transmembrane protein 74-like [Denticeps clupeoides]XP_028819819.1 transmembrane protein 74-like [Denticeps clupeoides]
MDEDLGNSADHWTLMVLTGLEEPGSRQDHEPCRTSFTHSGQKDAGDTLSQTSSSDTLEVDSPEASPDYCFISAVTFLVTGISLVIVSYTLRRDVTVSADDASAREMEALGRESARLGAHLDRCVIAGLCLLTLGGVVLSTLLMVSMWKDETLSTQSDKLYGSTRARLSVDEDDSVRLTQ